MNHRIRTLTKLAIVGLCAVGLLHCGGAGDERVGTSQSDLSIGPGPSPGPVLDAQLVPHVLAVQCKSAATPTASVTYVVENVGLAPAGASTVAFANTYPAGPTTVTAVPPLAVGASSASITTIVQTDAYGSFGYVIKADASGSVPEQNASESTYEAYGCP
jgi:hypothetical protein